MELVWEYPFLNHLNLPQSSTRVLAAAKQAVSLVTAIGAHSPEVVGPETFRWSQNDTLQAGTKPKGHL